ncbi:MAG: autotransporter outer membrane beta-barrel domain-containing protein [Rickettsiaceae bacterium]|nr:autotransporter outer membrane beta-barrel domain-containing protein [Rickettsiaceae bacterium]
MNFNITKFSKIQNLMRFFIFYVFVLVPLVTYAMPDDDLPWTRERFDKHTAGFLFKQKIDFASQLEREGKVDDLNYFFGRNSEPDDYTIPSYPDSDSEVESSGDNPFARPISQRALDNAFNKLSTTTQSGSTPDSHTSDAPNFHASEAINRSHTLSGIPIISDSKQNTNQPGGKLPVTEFITPSSSGNNRVQNIIKAGLDDFNTTPTVTSPVRLGIEALDPTNQTGSSNPIPSDEVSAITPTSEGVRKKKTQNNQTNPHPFPPLDDHTFSPSNTREPQNTAALKNPNSTFIEPHTMTPGESSIGYSNALSAAAGAATVAAGYNGYYYISDYYNTEHSQNVNSANDIDVLSTTNINQESGNKETQNTNASSSATHSNTQGQNKSRIDNLSQEKQKLDLLSGNYAKFFNEKTLTDQVNDIVGNLKNIKPEVYYFISNKPVEAQIFKECIETLYNNSSLVNDIDVTDALNSRLSTIKSTQNLGVAAGPETSRFGPWVKFIAGSAKQKNAPSLSYLKTNTRGAVLGIDSEYLDDKLTVGFAAAHLVHSNKFQRDNTNQYTRVTRSYLGVIYGDYLLSPEMNIDMTLKYSRSFAKINNSSSIFASAKSQFDAIGLDSNLYYNKDLGLDYFITPSAGIKISSISSEKITEQTNFTRIEAKKNFQSQLSSKFDLALSKAYDTEFAAIIPSIFIGSETPILSNTSKVSAYILDEGGSNILIGKKATKKFGLIYNTGFAIEFSRNSLVNLSLGYKYSFRKNFSANNIYLDFRTNL